MRASHVVFVAIVLKVLGRWSHNEPAVTIGGVAGAVFLLIVIGILDNGRTEEIAKGLAWLILAAVILANDSIVPGVAKLVSNNAPLEPSNSQGKAP